MDIWVVYYSLSIWVSSCGSGHLAKITDSFLTHRNPLMRNVYILNGFLKRLISVISFQQFGRIFFASRAISCSMHFWIGKKPTKSFKFTPTFPLVQKIRKNQIWMVLLKRCFTFYQGKVTCYYTSLFPSKSINYP